jgi:radical SAM protein with 4Fe4S-binding SPASM domain
MQANTTDALNLLSKLNGRRIGNFALLRLSYGLAKLFRKPIHYGMPAILEIEPTTSCNLRCPQCTSGLRQFTRNTGMLDLELFQKIIDEVHKDLVWLVLYWQGEPFLNKQLLAFVKYAASKNIYTATSTNAHYFTPETAKATVQSGLDRLIVSIDGISQSSYEKYRVGGNLDKVIEGTREILKWKKQLNRSTPHVIWQFIVFKHNEHELADVQRMAKEIGVDALEIKSAQVYGYESDSEFIPKKSTNSRYEKLANDTYRIKNDFQNKCWKMWRSSVITWDGLVVPCCFDKNAHHQLGSVSQQTFAGIWKGNAYNRFRNSILQSRKEIEMCLNCTEGTKK